MIYQKLPKLEIRHFSALLLLFLPLGISIFTLPSPIFLLSEILKALCLCEYMRSQDTTSLIPNLRLGGFKEL